MVRRNGRDFSDGVGTISREMLELVWRVYGTRRLLKPSLLRIRFQGHKGMVSLDSELRGKRIMLRENMKKFEAPSAWNLEICGAGFRPLPMILNRQLIKLLEDLSIPADVFMDLQTTAVDSIRIMTASAINTSHFLEQADMTRATRVSYLIRKLGQIGLEYHQDQFLYRVVELIVITTLRDIKYQGRTAVENGVTLYGIMDETGFLQEGDIYVTTENAPRGGRWELIQDRVVVTRSPVMHPGDVQVVSAVGVPAGSPLRALRNAVVFSQHGARDFPSMLSGGDLDGDLYNVIWDHRLIPATAHQPADYPRVSAIELTERSHAKTCRTSSSWAHMASISVDFSKTGIPVEMKECPRRDRIRPDFIAPSPRVFIEKHGPLQFEDDQAPDESLEDLDVEVPPMRYYRSQKVLGRLYHEIDERQFLLAMQQEHEAILLSAVSSSSLPEKLLQYMLRQATQFGIMCDQHIDLAVDIRCGYQDSLLDLLQQYGPSSHQLATEYEAFAGCNLGRRGGAQGKPLRELSKKLREQFESVCDYTTMRIVKGDAQMQVAADLDELYDESGIDREVEALPRAIACLKNAVEEKGATYRRVGELQSFKYIAAAVRLSELERLRAPFGSTVLPHV